MTTQTGQSGQQSAARKYFVMGPDVRGGGKGHGVKLVNEDALTYPGLVMFLRPRDQSPGFGYFKERPQLIYDRRQGNLPRDLEPYAGYWLVSEQMRSVLESVDAKGFAFVECSFTMPDGSAGPRYFLCDVVPGLDALNKQASTIRILIDKDHDTGEESEVYGITGKTKLVFNDEIVGSAHVFRQKKLAIGSGAICDEALYSACKAAGLTGIQFDDFNS